MAIVDDPPSGWGSNSEDLEYEEDWEAEDSFAQELCEKMKPGRGCPLIGKFYFWYCVGLEVFEITSPTTLDEIIKTMKERGDRAVKTKRLL
ncbi:hypothetical protein N7528_009444 [Penicillium herquei]|nr:hypothetical protein N7528_009444 [Penicillium herquei]